MKKVTNLERKMKFSFIGILSSFWLFAIIVLMPSFSNAQGSQDALKFKPPTWGGDQKDWVNMPDLSISGDFTIQFWVRLDNPGTYYDAVVGQEGTGQDINFDNNKLRLYTPGYSPANTIIASTPNRPYKWVNYAITRKGSIVTLYYDGIIDAVDSSSNFTGAFTPKAIGRGNRYGAASYTALNGQLDNFSIWSRALDKNEVRQYITQRLKGTESGLLVYYTFDDISSQTITDLSGNSNDAVLGSTSSASTDDPQIVESGAAIGDTSVFAYDFSSSPNTVLLSLKSPDGDSAYIKDVILNGGGAIANGFHLYMVNETPNHTTAPTGLVTISSVRYWGVFVPNGDSTNTQWDFHYTYDGHPGITQEDSLDLAWRLYNFRTDWYSNSVVTKSGKTLERANLQFWRQLQFVLGTSDPSDPLPVEMTYFKGNKIDDNAVELTWETASEKDAAYFEVQRSSNGVDFEKIGEVNAAGFSLSPIQYSFIDQAPFHGVNYYRLKKVDFDGSLDYTNIVVVETQAQSIKAISLYNNPINENTLKARVTIEKDGFYGVSILNLSGQNLYDENINLKKGYHDFDINIGNAPKGIYLLRIQGANSTEFTKFVKK